MKYQQKLFRGFIDETEEVFYIAHKHVFVHWQHLFRTAFLGLLLPSFFYWLFPDAYLAWGAWGFMGFLVFIYDVCDWFFDVWLLTDQGVVDIEWNGFFDRSATRIDYNMIEGISYQVKGFWPTVLNFGDVVLERVGAGTPVRLENAHRPRKIERAVVKYQDKFVNTKAYRDHNTLKGLLSEMLAQHVAEHGAPDQVVNK